MTGGCQGGRSSRPSPAIRPMDRRHMKKLDRAISKLDYAIWINSAWNHRLADEQRAKRKKLDG